MSNTKTAPMEICEHWGHYIRVNANGTIVHGFSDAFEKPEDGDVLLTDQGSYQFRLFPGGAENQAIFNENGIPLYKWDGERVLPRTQAEIDADTPGPDPGELTQAERMDQIEAALCELADMVTGGVV